LFKNLFCIETREDFVIQTGDNYLKVIKQKRSGTDVRRITIILDEELEGNLRKIQAELIKKTNRSKSFSQVINDLLKKSLK